MNFSDLPNDPVHEILLNLSPVDLINQCQTDYRLNRLCQDPAFLALYYHRYGLTSDQIPGRNIPEKLLFLSGFNWDVVPGATLSEKGRFIADVIQRAETADLTTFVQRRYGGPRARALFAGMDYIINRGFRNVLGRAVQTGNPQFVQMILNRLIERIGPQNLLAYRDSFRDAFVDVMGMANREGELRPQTWYEISNIILQYYDPLQDPVIFSGDYATAIRRGDLPRVKGLSRIFPPDEEGFWMAVDNAQPEVAAYFWNNLQGRGINPVTNNPEGVEETYEIAILYGDLSSLRVLTQYVPPSPDYVALAERANQPEVAAFLRGLLESIVSTRLESH